MMIPTRRLGKFVVFHQDFPRTTLLFSFFFSFSNAYCRLLLATRRPFFAHTKKLHWKLKVVLRKKSKFKVFFCKEAAMEKSLLTLMQIVLKQCMILNEILILKPLLFPHSSPQVSSNVVNAEVEKSSLSIVENSEKFSCRLITIGFVSFFLSPLHTINLLMRRKLCNFANIHAPFPTFSLSFSPWWAPFARLTWIVAVLLNGVYILNLAPS